VNRLPVRKSDATMAARFGRSGCLWRVRKRQPCCHTGRATRGTGRIRSLARGGAEARTFRTTIEALKRREVKSVLMDSLSDHALQRLGSDMVSSLQG